MIYSHQNIVGGFQNLINSHQSIAGNIDRISEYDLQPGGISEYDLHRTGGAITAIRDFRI